MRNIDRLTPIMLNFELVELADTALEPALPPPFLAAG